MRTKIQTTSRVLTIVNVFCVLACLARSVYLRLIANDLQRDGNLPPDARTIFEIHWPFWIVTAIVLVALLFAKERIHRAWIPLILNFLVIPACLCYTVYDEVRVFPAHRYVGSGTWEDDPKNWHRAFGEEKPPEVTVIHSKYWHSDHWTEEHMYFFEVKASPEWRAAFLRGRGVELVTPSHARGFQLHLGGFDVPTWFVPGQVSEYDVYDQPGYHGDIWIDKANDHIYFWGSLL